MPLDLRLLKYSTAIGAALAGIAVYFDRHVTRPPHIHSQQGVSFSTQRVCFANLQTLPRTQWDFDWDTGREGLLAQNNSIPSVASSNQGSSSGKPKSRRVTRYLILIRHGQYNLDGEHDPDRKLTALGREQARLTGERLRSLRTELQLPMTRMVHSSLTRAVETAGIIHDALRSASSQSPTTSATSPSSSQSASAAVAPDEGIVADNGNGRDDDTCPADNTTSPNPQASVRKLSSSPTPPVATSGSLPVEEDPQLREGTPFMTEPMLSHWVPSDKTIAKHGPRIEEAFHRHFHRPPESQTESSYEVIVCHANVIRYFVCRALQLPPDAWLRMNLAHGSITTLAIHSDGRVALYELGNSGHMPPNFVTYS